MAGPLGGFILGFIGLIPGGPETNHKILIKLYHCFTETLQKITTTITT